MLSHVPLDGTCDWTLLRPPYIWLRFCPSRWGGPFVLGHPRQASLQIPLPVTPTTYWSGVACLSFLSFSLSSRSTHRGQVQGSSGKCQLCKPIVRFSSFTCLSLGAVYIIGKWLVCKYFPPVFYLAYYCVWAYKCFKFLLTQIYQPFSFLLLDLEELFGYFFPTHAFFLHSYGFILYLSLLYIYNLPFCKQWIKFNFLNRAIHLLQYYYFEMLPFNVLKLISNWICFWISYSIPFICLSIQVPELTSNYSGLN